jgi:hypothetical protein
MLILSAKSLHSGKNGRPVVAKRYGRDHRPEKQDQEHNLDLPAMVATGPAGVKGVFQTSSGGGERRTDLSVQRGDRSSKPEAHGG